ncbi:hypothetical protein BJY52DRAFT_163769 [Lactarius psammicola]|nr:hypothetical protein BJY52DRAFT_163769 [Lactarius psammicola]
MVTDGANVLSVRSRTTRSSKGKLLSDPDANTQQLTEQLGQLGLYAADTTGDGNCLFRALSDQLYGTESRHLQLRRDICDWIQSHSVRYAPFVDDERGLDVHLSLMRQPATYGGHLELSAFAHMKKCNVKVIQPGLVYLIEWAAGWDAVAVAKDTPTSSSSSLVTTLVEREPIVNDRSRRAARRESRRAERDKARADKATTDEEDCVHKDNVTPTVYVAYHDWEHFSSIRNLRGPHSGLPDVCELPADASPHDLPSIPKSPSKPASKARPRAASTTTTTKLPPVPVSAPKPLSRPRRTSRVLRQSGSSATVVPAVAPPTPADIPLPSSRSASPPPAPSLPPGLYTREREHRSPKRSFDESSGSSDVSAASTSAAKRTRRGTVRGLAAVVQDADADMDADVDVDGDGDPDADADVDDADTPALSETASLSPISSPSPSPSPPPVPAPVPRRLTKRERKAAGLPRPRGSAGKIVIPGGRFRATPASESADPVQGEWARNGTGRVDVRGFRELRI